MNSSAVKGIEASSSDIVVEMKKELDKKKQTKKKKTDKIPWKFRRMLAAR